MADKGPDAFRTISEVADDLDVPQHVLRFWETRFSQIKPMKRGGGRRYYRPDDVDLLRGIRKLLYGDGYTIKGVQRILKDRGIRHVISIGAGQPVQAETAEPVAAEAEGASRTASPPPPQAAASPAPIAPEAAPAPAVSRHQEPVSEYAPPAQSRPVPPAPAVEPPPSPVSSPKMPEPAAAPSGEAAPIPRLDSLRMFAHDRVTTSTQADSAPKAAVEQPREQREPVAPPPAAQAPVAVPAVGQVGQALTAEDIRRLQAVLFELGECRQTLTEALKR
ncbi:MAG: MerR family transcriptional regulator [Rhodobiaceae bacterium]|nr:MerR family transcriptional regulator [Rhodobiaceae bacterium]MCC0048689.1 MerR family transcriptional regulator [Rhodobiaceae bacterium]